MKPPLVSVVMSVYNGQEYLADAIESILGQSYNDFEFIIIDDGSSDKSGSILKTYAGKDKRIKLLSQANKGLVASLNRGMKTARGKYVARQDADDKSEPMRLEKQIKFLEDHQHIVIVGSSIHVMDEGGHIMHQHAVLLNDPELRQELLIRSPFAHGSVVFRRDEAVKAGLYDAESWPAEDYDLWLRLSRHGQLASLDSYLYIYREHGEGISAQNQKEQQSRVQAIQAKAWMEKDNLLSGPKPNLGSYAKLDMGQLRIQRIIDNSLFISSRAWQQDHRKLAMKNLLGLATNRYAYRKAAGRLKRKLS
jgi:glycosyltransferase involved in cell wall biosynthesis